MHRLVVGIFALLTLASLSASALAQETFFKDKTIRVVVGFSAGGGFDTYSRVIGRYMGKHIPGNPAIIVENMTGAASLISANHVYKVAKPDGLTILNFHGNQVLNQVIGKPGIEFDARKFEYLGVPTQDSGACAFTKASGAATYEQLKSAKTPVKLGGVASGDTTYNTSKILKEALHLPIQLVAGYKGTAEIRLAAESGEVAGGCWQWESIKVIWRQGLESGNVSIALQVNPKPHPELKNVPNAIDLATSENGKQLIKFGIHDPAAVTRLYAVSPGTPKDRVQILRKAFTDVLKDADFQAEAKKSQLDTNPLTGEEVEKTVAGLFKIQPGLVAQLKEILQ
ncbi:MAG TPA: tripartite tricarboxylate transporter substrate-binding protein [Candidatus Binatia bacterium]|jgi:tripartite-type tricarboxylate transporter receptor subunit TctC